MDTLTYRVKVKDVLFFASLAMISIAAHAALLFGFDLSLLPSKKPAEKQMMKIDFVRRIMSAPEKPARFKPSAAPDPTVPERPKMKKNAQPPPAPAPEEIEPAYEVPEEFSQFLDELKDAERITEFEFKGDSYDVLAGGSPIAAPDKGAARGIQGIPENLLDPRVQMVVTRVPRNAGKNPPTFIETKYSQIRYPNIQIEKKDYQKGWLSVYLVISISSKGKIEDIRQIRPREPGDLETLFIDALMEAVNTWTFDRKSSFIHVDVRFYVE